MIKSMTGFTSVTREDDRATISVTIRALNHRHLDMQLRVPAACAAIEGDLGRSAADACGSDHPIDLRYGLSGRFLHQQGKSTFQDETRQFAGPLHRCDKADPIGPLRLQHRALGGLVVGEASPQLRRGRPAGTQGQDHRFIGMVGVRKMGARLSRT